MEIEAKYTIPSKQVFQELQRLETLGAFRLQEGRVAALHDTYLDTADRAIWRAGYALRRREKSGALVMTLKALDGGDGPVKRREELEVALPEAAPPALWPPSAARERVLEIAGEQAILPLFDLRQTRHERTVVAEERAVSVLSLDAVTLTDAAPTGAARSTHFYVLEAELLPTGAEADLAAIMAALQETWQLRPDPESKLQRALAFFGMEMPAAPGLTLSAAEHALLAALAAQPGMYGRRAQALLLLANGATQIEAAEEARMSERRVRHWLAEWRQKRLDIFPEKLRHATPTTAATEADAAETAAAEASVAPAAAMETPIAVSPADAPQVDFVHLNAVRHHAAALFDLLQPWHARPAADRELLCEIAQLHDVGVNIAPEQHDLAGYEQLTAQPPAQLAPEDARIAAIVTLLHSRRLKAKTLQALLDHTDFAALPLEAQHRALVLAALLRMADGLDFRHTGSTEICAIEENAADGSLAITVTGPVAGSDAERANFKADLWARIFNRPVHFQTPPLGSTELLAHLLQAPEASSAPESIALPAAPGINLDDTVTEAARKTFLFHFQRMLYHEPGARLGDDIEALHDMRVASRRMRTAAQVFAAHLDNETLRPFIKGLRRTGDTLGAVRDLDVFWEKTEHFLETLEGQPRPDLSPLHRVWERAREQARAQMLVYLDSNAYRRFRERFAAYLETPWTPPTPAFNLKGEALPQRVRDVAPILIAERVAAVRAYDPWMRAADVPLTRYHRLRIASKRLRYALEYFAEVLGPAAKPLINQVKLLQDHLGDLQDAVVASNLLRDFLVWGTWGHAETPALPEEPVVAPGVAAYLTARQVELQQRRDGFLSLWEQFNGAEFARLVADVIAAL